MFKSEKLLAILLFCAFALLGIGETNSFFGSNVVNTNNYVNIESSSKVNFYFRQDKNAIGFELTGISSFERVRFMVKYADVNSNTQVITGDRLNAEGSDTMLEEWLILGTCSDLGTVCVYNTPVEEIVLSVELFREGNMVKIIEATLESK